MVIVPFPGVVPSERSSTIQLEAEPRSFHVSTVASGENSAIVRLLTLGQFGCSILIASIAAGGCAA